MVAWGKIVEEMKGMCIGDIDETNRKCNVMGSNFVDVSSCLGNRLDLGMMIITLERGFGAINKMILERYLQDDLSKRGRHQHN